MLDESSRISSKVCNPMRVLTRRICLGLVCSCAGVVVDIDHIFAHYTGHDARYLHKAFGICGIGLVVGGIGFLLTSVRRYKQTRILRR